MYIWGVVEALSLYWHSSDRTDRQPCSSATSRRTTLRHGFGGGRIASFVERRQLAIAVLDEHPAGRTWMAHGAELDRDQLITYALDQLASSDDA